MQGTTVTVGGVTFYGAESPQDRTEGFMLTEFEGWNDAPSARSDSVARPNSHGDFALPATRGPRLITMSGWCRAFSSEKQGRLRSRFLGVLADGRFGQVTVEEFGETMRATVQLYGDPRFRKRGSSGYADWSLALRAPNPRKFGETHEYAAGEGAFHRGNFPATPVFTIEGPQPAYTISAGGKQYTVSTALPSGSTDVIDMSNGWCRRNGTILRSGVSRADTWTVPPGLPALVHTFSGDSSRFVVNLADTYI